ncbi:MAG: ECF transporter S component [Clostridia bacterium]|nr:ECF transporter S component [Clostridia bacterium]
MKKVNTLKLVGVALLTAIVVVLQLVGGSIRFGTFSITLSLVPIVIGAALYGKRAGAWLGFIFGYMTLLDAAPFFAVNVPGTIIVCLLKGTLAGFLAGVVFSLVEKKNTTLGVVLAAITAPIVNTGTFLLGCCVFFYDTVQSWGEALGFDNAFVYMIVGFVGVNFLIEMATNMILSPAIVRLIAEGRKAVGSKSNHKQAKA